MRKRKRKRRVSNLLYSEIVFFHTDSVTMEERAGIRGRNPANYGAVGQPFQPNYLMNPDPEQAPLLPGFTNDPDGKMASAAMNPAMAPPYYAPDGAALLTNPAIGMDGPTAPSHEWVDIPGYEGMGTGDDGRKVLPPPYFGPDPGAVPSPPDTNWIVPFISEDDARKALLDYANNKCCYGSTPAKEMDFHVLRPFNTYRYRLETFTESRTCKWVTKSYTGQAVDSPVSGPAPLPWEMPVQVPSMFQDEEKKMPVPHTSSLKPCPQCLGTCKMVCEKCHGTRRVRCWVCNGSGHRHSDQCHHCRGVGTERWSTDLSDRQCGPALGTGMLIPLPNSSHVARTYKCICSACHSTGYKKCEGCSGHGQILNYIQLTVTWKNNIYEFVADHNSEFTTDLFKKVNGQKIFTDEQLLLYPLVNFPTPSINQASQNALQQHHAQFSSSTRMLRQRHSIEWLPLTKVEYNWRGQRYDYFVYGKENKVYTDNYPQKCCCTVM